MAFLTDVKLYGRHLRLEPSQLSKAWDGYSFEKTSHFLDAKSLSAYSWKTDHHIDYRNYVVRPIVYLIVDEIDKPDYGQSTEEVVIGEIGVESDLTVSKEKIPKFNEIIKSSPVYYAAIKYAYQRGGSMKIFHRSEDMRMITDDDTLVYVGEVSRKIAAGFKHAYDVEVLSGLDVRKKVKNAK